MSIKKDKMSSMYTFLSWPLILFALIKRNLMRAKSLNSMKNSVTVLTAVHDDIDISIFDKIVCYGTVTYPFMDTSKFYIYREPSTSRILDTLPIPEWQVSLAYATTFLCILLLQYIFKLVPCSELSSVVPTWVHINISLSWFGFMAFNPYRLIHRKSCLSISIKYMWFVNTYFVDNIFKRSRAHLFTH